MNGLHVQVVFGCALAASFLYLSAGKSTGLADKEKALKYLKQYHYLSSLPAGNHDVAKAIKNLQRFFGLKQTGGLDEETMKTMSEKRCGDPDMDDVGYERRRRKRYEVTMGWRTNDLTYSIQYGKAMSHAAQDAIFTKAFKMWSDVSNLKFTKAKDPSKAYIKLSFGSGKHKGKYDRRSCIHNFDGTGPVVAHARYPEDGRAHFDDDEKFVAGTPRSAREISLLPIALHEIGHVLGLEHSGIKTSIMYPAYLGYRKDLKLDKDDIAGIQHLYGKRGEKVCRDLFGKETCEYYSSVVGCEAIGKECGITCKAC